MEHPLPDMEISGVMLHPLARHFLRTVPLPQSSAKDAVFSEAIRVSSEAYRAT